MAQEGSTLIVDEKVAATGALAVDAIYRGEVPKERQDEEGFGRPMDEAVETRGQIEFPGQKTTEPQTYPEERWLSEMVHSTQERMKAAGRSPMMGESANAAAPDCKKKLQERLDVVSYANG